MSAPNLGDRVRVSLGGGWTPRVGILTGILYGQAGTVPTQWFVTFDGERGQSGPYFYIEPE